jgi:hypothetical protein
MPVVIMPDGTPVNMPDKISPDQARRLRAIQERSKSKQSQPQTQEPGRDGKDIISLDTMQKYGGGAGATIAGAIGLDPEKGREFGSAAAKGFTGSIRAISHPLDTLGDVVENLPNTVSSIAGEARNIWDDPVGEAKRGVQAIQDITPEQAGDIFGSTIGGFGAGKLVGELGSAVKGAYRAVKPASKAEKTGAVLGSEAEQARSRIAAEEQARSERNISEYNRTVQEADAKMDRASKEADIAEREAIAVERERAAGEMKKATQTEAAARAELETLTDDGRVATEAEFSERDPTYGNKARQDFAKANADALKVAEEGAGPEQPGRKDLYKAWDERVEDLDKTDPFAIAPAGRKFFKWLDSFKKPEPNAGVVKASQGFEKMVSGLRKRLTGYVEKKDVSGPEGKVTSLDVETPRFGKAIEEEYRMLRDKQARLKKRGYKTASKKIGDIADNLEKALKEWTGKDAAGKEYWPDEKFREIKRRSNVLASGITSDILEETEVPFGAAPGRFKMPWHQVPEKMFSGAESADEVIDVIGQKKFDSYAEQHALHKIRSMTPDQINKFIENPANSSWISKSPGLIDKIGKYRERLAIRSGRTDYLEAAAKGSQDAIKDATTRLTTAIKDIQSRTASVKSAASTERNKIVNKAIDITQQQMATDEKTLAARLKAADSLSDLLTGRTPREALKRFDEHVAEKLLSSPDFPPAKVQQFRQQLASLERIQNRQERIKMTRKIILGLFGADVAVEKLKKVVGQ